MKLTSFTYLALLINRIIDQRPANDLSFPEIHAASRDGDLIGLLIRRFGHIADFYFIQCYPHRMEQMEAALSDAACALEGGRRYEASNSGLCLAMAIVLEAIQQQFPRFPSPPRQPTNPSIH